MKRVMTFLLSILFFACLLYPEYNQEITKYFDGRKFEKISIENVNGSINVKSWGKPEIYVFVKKTSRSKAILEKTEVIFDDSGKELRIKVKKRDFWRIFGGSIANVEIIVNTPSPKNLDLSTVNGSVKVNDMEGKTSASSVNGDISIHNHRGNIDSETVNGGINLSKIYGALKAETVNGSINSEVLEVGEYINLSTVNGSVTLKIGNIKNAEFNIETVNGGINIEEFQMPMKRLSLKKRSAYFVLGDGSKKINIETVNGSIKISALEKSI
jgi:DUF4097 and DUF4098 domain-containing protein YvlB